MSTNSARRHMTRIEGIKPVDWASDKQEDAFYYGPYPLCCSGGFGSAKTFSLCLKALYVSALFPNNRGLIARKVWDELKKTTMSTFFKTDLCDSSYYDEGRRSDTEKSLKLNNGSEILWMHMDDPETENVIRGIEINWFILDQAEEISEEIFDLLMTRLGRWDKAEVPEHYLESQGGIEKWPWVHPNNNKALVPTYPMIACNPDTELHWIYRRFHPESDEFSKRSIPVLDRVGKQITRKGVPLMTSYKRLGYHMIQMASYDNKHLPDQNLALMMQKDETFRRRFVHGHWGIPEGQIHTVDNKSILRCEHDNNPGVPVAFDDLLSYFHQFCSLYRVMDHGDASPTCCLWFAVDGEGNLFCYREYYEPNLLVSQHRAAITFLSEGESYKADLADPAIFYKTQQKHGGRWSVADEYSDWRNSGLPRDTAINWQPADNNEMGTRNRISEALKLDSGRVHPITKEKGSPSLFFVMKSGIHPNGCEYTLRETRMARRKKVGSKEGKALFGDERDPKISDHAYDPVRYMVASRAPASKPMPSGPPPNSWAAVNDDLQRFQRRKGFKIAARRAKSRHRRQRF